MRVTDTAIPDVKLVEPRVFKDARGHFYESFNHRAFEAAIGREVSFVQDNHSHSRRGVLRGLHYQLPPHAQGKLVRVVRGEIFDVAVDIRKSSPTFGAWVAERLSAENRRQMWIPEGFAHGFLVLSDAAEVLYKATDYYAPGAEGCVRWDCPRLGINWPTLKGGVQCSPKDLKARGLGAVETPTFL